VPPHARQACPQLAGALRCLLRTGGQAHLCAGEVGRCDARAGQCLARVVQRQALRLVGRLGATGLVAVLLEGALCLVGSAPGFLECLGGGPVVGRERAHRLSGGGAFLSQLRQACPRLADLAGVFGRVGAARLRSRAQGLELGRGSSHRHLQLVVTRAGLGQCCCRLALGGGGGGERGLLGPQRLGRGACGRLRGLQRLGVGYRLALGFGKRADQALLRCQAIDFLGQALELGRRIARPLAQAGHLARQRHQLAIAGGVHFNDDIGFDRVRHDALISSMLRAGLAALPGQPGGCGLGGHRRSGGIGRRARADGDRPVQRSPALARPDCRASVGHHAGERYSSTNGDRPAPGISSLPLSGASLTSSCRKS